MRTSPYSNALGAQPGVQVKTDQADAFELSAVADQIVAMGSRASRGPIDRAFLVTRQDAERRMGPPRSNLVRSIHEARMQVADTLDAGAAGVVVSRMVPAAARKLYAIVRFGLVDRIEPGLPEWIVYLLNTESDQLYPSVLNGLIDNSGMGGNWQIYLRKIYAVRDSSGNLISYSYINDDVPPNGVWVGGTEQPTLSAPSDLGLVGIWSYSPPYYSSGIMQIASDSGMNLMINFSDFFGYASSSFEYSWAGGV